MENNKLGKISIHHIGGRAGTRAFPVLDLFEKDFVNVLYDADVECIDQIKEYNENLNSELHVLPYCVGDNNKVSELNITYDPFTSSLKELNSEYKDFYMNIKSMDYVLSDAINIIEKRKVQLVTLDWIFENNTSIPKPDFLSIDTQGTEYEIIQGGMKTINENVVGIILESGFHEVYKEQKLFGDISKVLSDNGFYFVKFMNLEKLSPYRAPIKLRGDGFNTGCDALFLKKISSIEKLPKEDWAKKNMLQKLAFICIVFGQYEYGIQCLNSIKLNKYNNVFDDEMNRFNYITFLNKLEEVIKNVPKDFQKTFSSEFTVEQSKARFKAKGKSSDKPNEIQTLISTDEMFTFKDVLKGYGLSEYNDIVSNEMMQIERFKKYYNMLNRWLKIKGENINIENYFVNNNADIIGIWGAGEIGNRLFEELENTKIKVKYFIDSGSINKKIKTIPVINFKEYLADQKKVDAIIVTPIYDFIKIKSYLLENGVKTKIISLEEIIDELNNI